MERRIFSGAVIRKFITGSDYERFLKSYNENKGNSGRGAREVNAKDMEILKDYKNGIKNTRVLAEKHGVNRASVLSSLRLAALSQI